MRNIIAEYQVIIAATIIALGLIVSASIIAPNRYASAQSGLVVDLKTGTVFRNGELWSELPRQ